MDLRSHKKDTKRELDISDDDYAANNRDGSYDSSYSSLENEEKAKYNDETIGSAKPFFGFECLTDERGYARDGKVEELETQLEKAKKLGRLTDDRAFIIDENYVKNRCDHYESDDYNEDGEYTGNYWGK